MPRLESIQKMLLGNPDDVFLNFALAMEYLQAGRRKEAAARFHRVIELDPNYVSAYQQQASALIALGRPEEAGAVLAEGIAAARRAGDNHAADRMQNTLTTLTRP